MIPGSQFLPRSLRKTHTQHHGGFCGGKTSENLFSSENIITIIIVVVVIVAHTHWGGTIRGCGPCTGVQSLRRRVLRAVVLTPTEKPTPTPLLDELNERRTKVHTASGNVGCCTFIFRDFGLRCGAFWGVGMLDEKKGVGRIGGGGWVTGNSLLWGRFSRLCGVGGWAVVAGCWNLGKNICNNCYFVDTPFCLFKNKFCRNNFKNKFSKQWFQWFPLKRSTNALCKKAKVAPPGRHTLGLNTSHFEWMHSHK